MVRRTERIGRPGASLHRIRKENGWILATVKASGTGGVVSSEQTVAGKIAFGSPVLRMNSAAEYWFSWRYNIHTRFNDANGSLRFRQARSGEVTSFDRSISNNGVNRCEGSAAAILGIGKAPVIYIPAGESDGRCRVNCNLNISLGSNVCEFDGSHTFLILSHGGIDDINLDGLDSTWGTVTVDVIDL